MPILTDLHGRQTDYSALHQPAPPHLLTWVSGRPLVWVRGHGHCVVHNSVVRVRTGETTHLIVTPLRAPCALPAVPVEDCAPITNVHPLRRPARPGGLHA